MGEQRIAIRRYCDKPMARSKKLLGKCKEDCKNCYCCIEVDTEGDKQHVKVKDR